jgi:rare lipoprotein A
MPAVTGAVVTFVLVGGAVAAVYVEGREGGGHPVTLATSASPTVDPIDLSQDADRSADRADRGEMRDAPSPSPSSPSPSPTRSPTPTPKRSTSSPAGGGSVTSTGTCQASYYATGSTTANGEAYDPDGITAAHKTLPFNTKVRVTNQANGSSVVVRINDRGPFVSGRCLDLSRGAFKTIASLGAGVVSVRYEVLA